MGVYDCLILFLVFYYLDVRLDGEIGERALLEC